MKNNICVSNDYPVEKLDNLRNFESNIYIENSLFKEYNNLKIQYSKMNGWNMQKHGKIHFKNSKIFFPKCDRYGRDATISEGYLVIKFSRTIDNHIETSIYFFNTDTKRLNTGSFECRSYFHIDENIAREFHVKIL